MFPWISHPKSHVVIYTPPSGQINPETREFAEQMGVATALGIVLWALVIMGAIVGGKMLADWMSGGAR